MTFIGAPKFDISNSAVLIIFAQTVTWIGHYFSPLLPVVFAIVLFVTFYVKKVTKDILPSYTSLLRCSFTLMMWISVEP